MNFDFDDDQRSIKSTAREFLASRSKFEKVRECSEGGHYDEAIWKEMIDLGWAGIFIPEQYGGQELGVVELVILQEELGYAVTPSPFFSNAAAGLMVLHAGSDEQKERLLPGVASGEATGTVGILHDGSAPLVPDAEAASFIVLAGEGDTTRIVEAGDAKIEHRDTIDGTRSFARVSGEGEEMPGDAGAGLDRACAALAAELTGCSQRAMEMAVEYAKDRKQFERPIGAYQGVSHRCAEMLLETEGARAATYYAGWAADHEPESLPAAASMAKAYASDAGWRVTASSLQVHGGIGFTWEHDLHFLLKRAKTDGHLLGGASWHRDRVAKIAGLGDAVIAQV
ncbi:MAG: acyl-CoA/acyl-ACP dehydrogenase [Thermoleophilaceae bacterium]|nr:acyl-CoA/acyl-ACP dehydrogenase [Thermoleophilaceae bacterium]